MDLDFRHTRPSARCRTSAVLRLEGLRVGGVEVARSSV